MNSLLLEQVKAAKLPPAYVYVADMGRYRDAVTGRFVALKTVFGLLNKNEAASLEKLQNLSRALADGKLPVQAWYLAMQQQLRRLSVQNAALAVGGFDALKQRDLTRIDAALRDDWERLNRFGADILAGRLSAAQINSRAAMYAGHARMQYYATLPKPKTKPNQVVLERRRLGTAEHCSFCTYLVNLGWQPYGTLPLPGESDPDWQDDQCFTNCHCDLERQVFSKVEAATLVKPLKAFFAFNYSHTNKGGEGSGNFHHAGRPGHQGGSAPQNGKLLPNYQAKDFGVPKGNDLSFDEAIQRYDYNGHPMLTMYLGKQDRYMDSSSWLSSLPSKRKGEVVDALAKGTGLPGYECSDFIKEWANTSNDHNLASLTIQEEAAKLFGGDLTEWQRTRLEGAQIVRDGILRSALDEVPEEPGALIGAGENIFRQLQARKPPILLPFERANFRKMLDDLADEVDNAAVDLTRSELERRIAAVEQEAKDKTSKALRFVYDHTQETLKQAGIKELHVFRGAVLPDSVAADFKVGEAAKVQSNLLSSWSLAQETAAEFAEGVGGGQLNTKGTRSVVFDAIIPASRVYATPVTGQGCLLEWEVVVIGSQQDTVRVYAVDDEMVKAFIKGGEGSGNFGHAGRPGKVGGSAPADTAAPAHKDSKQTKVLDSTTPWDRGYLDYFGLTQDDLHQAVDLGIPDSQAILKYSRVPSDQNSLRVRCVWKDGEGNFIGECERVLTIDPQDGVKTAYLEKLAFEAPYLKQGVGHRVATAWYRTLAEAGYTKASLEADMTIGRYAWAREGAQYEDASMPRWATDEFRKWAGSHGVQLDSDEWPRFTSPQDVANFKHPSYTLHGSDIDNEDVPGSLELSLGKAFMLDKGRYGHGSWNAVVDLTQWTEKGSSSKAADMPADSKISNMAYIEARGVPGATDGEFWTQYLTEEEGEPLFGFGKQFGKSFSIKGGEGSGNFHHAGRPGEVGGSAAGSDLEHDSSTSHQHTQVEIEKTNMSGDPLEGPEVLTDFGLSEHALTNMLDVGIPGSTCSVKLARDGDELTISGSWWDGNDMIGVFQRRLNFAEHTAYLEDLSFEKPYIGGGYGIKVARQWYVGMAAAGYEKAVLFADLTIGRYAWAKEGAQYLDDWSGPREANRKFAEWLNLRKVPEIAEDDYPIFQTPQDAANYKHPAGFTLLGRDIKNRDVPPDMELPIGKAFMLDNAGHGSWHAILNLTQWKDKGASTKAMHIPERVNSHSLSYVEVGHDIPGGSDADFWTQYLTEAEGEPLFGFGEQIGKSLPIKGGEGSGNFGHAGRPGEVGGSATDGIDNAAAGATEKPATASATHTGLRKGWDKEKRYLMYAYASETSWTSSMRDEAARIAEFRQKTDERVKLIEALSQEERADLYVSMLRNKSAYSVFQTKYDDAFQAALTTGDKQKIAEALSQMEPEQWVMDDHAFKLLASRLDEDHALQVMKDLAEDERRYLAKYPKGSKVPYEEEKQHTSLSWATHTLMEVGPTDKFRREAVALYQAVGGDMMSVAIASGNVDQDVARMVSFWTTDARTPGNPWVHAAAAKAFGGADKVTGYWNPNSYGVVYNDPDPGYVAAAKAIYQKTQAFYAKKKNKDFTVWRGVNSAVSVRSPLESWTLAQRTAEKFDGHAVLERTESVDRVFMTWEAMKGIFPEEKNLRGKKEVVLMGLDWMKP